MPRVAARGAAGACRIPARREKGARCDQVGTGRAIRTSSNCRCCPSKWTALQPEMCRHSFRKLVAQQAAMRIAEAIARKWIMSARMPSADAVTLSSPKLRSMQRRRFSELRLLGLKPVIELEKTRAPSISTPARKRGIHLDNSTPEEPIGIPRLALASDPSVPYLLRLAHGGSTSVAPPHGLAHAGHGLQSFAQRD